MHILEIKFPGSSGSVQQAIFSILEYLVRHAGQPGLQICVARMQDGSKDKNNTHGLYVVGLKPESLDLERTYASNEQTYNLPTPILSPFPEIPGGDSCRVYKFDT